MNAICTDLVEASFDGQLITGKYKHAVLDTNGIAEVFRIARTIRDIPDSYSIWDFTEVKYWTLKARELNSEELKKKKMAVAVIYTGHYALNIILNFYLKVFKTALPIQFFTDPAKARKWLENEIKRDALLKNLSDN